jgi:succinyl-diaminopimelate desuccinylase
VAYPHLADNPIHRCGAVIEALTSIEWDAGNDYFPPTSFQISNIAGGTGATNVIPASTALTFNLRYSTEIDEAGIKAKVRDVLDQLNIEYEEDWTLFGLPFLTEEGALVNACRHAIRDECGIETTLSTAGGTSDGRFIAPTGAQVVELGPVNATIHKVNECIDLTAPDQLSRVYEGILKQLLL